MELEQQIRQAITENGWGRTKLMRAFPEASEWLLRNIIAEERGGKPHTIQPVSERGLPNRTIVETLRPIEVRMPARPSKATPKVNPEYQFTMALLGDMHAPYHDPVFVRLAAAVLTYVSAIRLDEVVAMGDMWDFYAVSKYDKNPLRRNQLQDELIVGAEMMAVLTEPVQDIPKTFLKGNHEARLEKYIGRNAPALATLPQLQLPSVLGIESLGWRWEPNYYLVKDSFLVHHGDLVASAAGATAYRELGRAGISGASGHIHRLAAIPRTNWIQQIRGEPGSIWIETGCLCSPDQEYKEGKPTDWHPGMAIVQICEDGTVVPELIHFRDNTAVVRGTTISV